MATITDVGGAGNNTAAGTTQTLTTTTAIPAGTKLLLFAACTISGNTISSVSDSVGGNTYVVDANQAGAGASAVAVIRCDVAAGIPSGGTITVTWTTTVGAGPTNNKSLAGAYMTGLLAGAAHKTASNLGTANSSWDSGVTGATTVPCAAFGGGFDNAATDQPDTPTAPNVELHDFNGTGNGYCTATVYQLTVATGATPKANGSFGATGGDAWKAAIAVYALAADAGVGPVRIAHPFVGPMALRLKARRQFRQMPQAAAVATTVYTDTATGTITLSGTATEAQSHSSSPSGTITLSGTRTESQAHSSSPSGTVTLSGSVTQSQTHASSPAGSTTLSGTRTENQTHASSTAGTVTLNGSVVEDYQPPGGAGPTTYPDDRAARILLATHHF